MDLKIGRTGDPTLNRSKPIRFLTRTKCSCSDDCLPICFFLSDFQPNRRNFFVELPLFFTVNLTGVDPWGGCSASHRMSTTRLKGGRHERGFGLFLKELNMDSLNRRLESYCLQTTEALAYWIFLMHLPPTLPSWARSEDSIFFPTQNFKIRKGRRSCCEILRYPLGLGAKHLFFSQLKILRSERDVVAVARFSNFKSL